MKSQFSFTNLLTPSPSLPITRPIGPFRLVSKWSFSPISAQANQSPSFLSCSMVFTRFVTFATGIYSIAPAEVFPTVAFSPTERRFGIITPCAPAHSAVLRIAPRLCGSVMPSRRMIKGSSPFALAAARISSTST